MRVSLWPAIAFVLLLFPAGSRADRPQTWTEVRSPHFVVITNASAKQGRRVAEQFEQERGVFRVVLPGLRVDPGMPIVILAAKDEKTMHELLPAYWETKGRMHPAGIFAGNEDKNYMLLQLDATGDNPYGILYHEYVHLVMRLNFQQISVWSNEGMAEFYGHMTIGEKEITLGNPSDFHLRVLQTTKLLPLDVLLKADEHSPYYNENEKATVFYSEAWALTHMVMLGDPARHGQMSKYLELVSRGEVDAMEAARQAFGDLAELSKQLDRYTQKAFYTYLHMKSPAQLGDSDFPVRELTAAESLAARGDFYAHMERPVEARNLLQQAQALDGNLASIYESYGLLAIREKDLPKAGEAFEHAAQLDSKSFLAQYYAAFVTLQHATPETPLVTAEGRLKRAIELNPEFAESYSALSHLYALRGDKLDTALEMAVKAAKLEPGNFNHRINIGYVLLQMRRTADAQKLGERLQAQARTDENRSAVQAFLAQVQTFAQYEQKRKEYEEQQAERQKADEVNQKGAEQPGPNNGAITNTPPKLAHRTNSAAGPPAGPRLHALGKIAAVTCRALRLDMTLAAPGHTLLLHAENYYKLEYLSFNYQPPANFNPCTDLEGHDARVEYVAPGNAEDSGVLLIVELRGAGKK